MTILINFYQYLKPIRTALFSSLGIFPHSCRHTPSCSQYSKQQISRYGTIQGSFLTFKRLLTCHPFN